MFSPAFQPARAEAIRSAYRNPTGSRGFLPLQSHYFVTSVEEKPRIVISGELKKLL